MISSIFKIATFSACSSPSIKKNPAVDKLFAEWNQPNVPGGALGIVKEGKLIYTQGYGSGDLEHDMALTSHPNRKAITVGLEERTMMGYGITSNGFG